VGVEPVVDAGVDRVVGSSVGAVDVGGGLVGSVVGSAVGSVVEGDDSPLQPANTPAMAILLNARTSRLVGRRAIRSTCNLRYKKADTHNEGFMRFR
jgi:hypothetical protein